MAKYKSEDLLNDLAEDVKKIKVCAEYFLDVDKNKMIYSPDKGKWSIVQVLEHTNAYNRFYLPAIDKELSLISYDKNPWFTPGFLGDFATRLIKPKNVVDINNKMRSSRKYNFPNSLNVETVLKEFLSHQDHFLSLLERAKGKDLNRIKLPLTISNLIKFKLGDIFRFLIAHQQRHMIQARNTLKIVGEPTDKFPIVLQVVGQ